MTSTLLRKMVHDCWPVLLACTLMLLAFGWIRVQIISSVEAAKIYRVAQNLPEFVKRLSPVPIDELINYPGLISHSFEEPLVLLMMALWTFTHGSNSVSGELGRGTLEMILAQPVGRLRYLSLHAMVTVGGVLLLSAALLAGTKIGMATAMVDVSPRSLRFQLPLLGIKLPSPPPTASRAELVPLSTLVQPRTFVPAALNFAALGVFLAGATTLLSSVDRYRWRTLGAMTGFFVVQLVLELSGLAIDGWYWLRRLTILSLYEPVAISIAAARQPAAAWNFWATGSTGNYPDLGPLGFDTLLAGAGLLAILLAMIFFARRDLPAPL